METQNSSSSRDLPPGFRFHPTDEELIMYYLRNQATSKPCPVSIIPEVDIYKFDPWQLPEKAEFGEKEWYFFSPRDRKYPNGARPNRATVSGYWKATGTDKAIYSGSKYVGVKKALVFYKGRPPKGVKSDWIMHEYRLMNSNSQPNKHNGSMRLDDWVLCRIYKKRPMSKTLEQQFVENSHTQMAMGTSEVASEQNNMLSFPRTCSLTHLFEMENMGFMSQMFCDSSYNNNPTFDLQSMSNSNGSGSIENYQFDEIMPYKYADFGKYQTNQNQQSINVTHPVYQFQ